MAKGVKITKATKMAGMCSNTKNGQQCDSLRVIIQKGGVIIWQQRCLLYLFLVGFIRTLFELVPYFSWYLILVDTLL